MIYINGDLLIQDKFPDGTLNIKTTGFQKSHIRWRYENDAELFTLMCVVDQIRENYSDTKITLELPYIPNARMDRVKHVNDVFTLKTFCKAINAMNFEWVKVLDPHSNVAAGLIDRVIIEDVDIYIEDAIEHIQFNYGHDFALFFPDEGARKRYDKVIDRDEVAFGIKNRDWKTGEIKGLHIFGEENVKGKNVLIIDDICSRGGTFYHSAKALKEAGAKKIFLYITHCEDTIFKGNLQESGLIEHVYTTNSIFKPKNETEWITIV